MKGAAAATVYLLFQCIFFFIFDRVHSKMVHTKSCDEQQNENVNNIITFYTCGHHTKETSFAFQTDHSVTPQILDHAHPQNSKSNRNAI